MRDQTVYCQRCRDSRGRWQIRPDGLMVDLVCASCGWPVQGMEITIEDHRWFERKRTELRARLERRKARRPRALTP